VRIASREWPNSSPIFFKRITGFVYTHNLSSLVRGQFGTSILLIAIDIAQRGSLWWHNIVLLLKEGIAVREKNALYTRFGSNFGSVTVILIRPLSSYKFLVS
jgi:hypothetical protein